jgi:UDP-N-acetylglucosamine transferase subunit ALG13
MILVSVGTNEQPFDRLVAAAGVLAGSERVIIQHGASKLRPALAECREFMPFEEIEELVTASRAVVCHAGVGSVGVALRLGRRPIVMARRHRLGEAVDDHQVPFARRLARAGLVQVVEDVPGLVRALQRDSVTPPWLAAKATPLALELRDYLEGEAGVRQALTAIR